MGKWAKGENRLKIIFYSGVKTERRIYMEKVDYRTTKQKIEDAGRFVKRKAREGWEWVKDNRDGFDLRSCR